jgi:hypothetical protein
MVACVKINSYIYIRSQLINIILNVKSYIRIHHDMPYRSCIVKTGDVSDDDSLGADGKKRKCVLEGFGSRDDAIGFL